MNKQNIKPEKITKPIQLLAAWLAGLFSIDSCFLFAATNMEAGTFETIALVIAAILNVPLFLLAVFLLQTKFRPELQEDSYYSTYLSQKTNENITVSKSDVHILEIKQKIIALEKRITTEQEKSDDGTVEEISPLKNLRIGINKNLSDKEEIKSKLSEYGVISISTFGSSPPEQKAIAISYGVSNESITAILNLAKEIGLTHYGFFDNFAEETQEEVLIGSYGTAEYEVVTS